MPAPKSGIKLDKNGIVYESDVEACKYYLYELTRGALRDVMRFIRYRFRIELYDTFNRRTGKAPRSLKRVIYSSKSTKYPRGEIGIPKSAKGKPVEGFWNYWLEMDASTLKNVVMENIQTIIEIESQYLSGLNKDKNLIELDIDDSEDLIEEAEE